MSEPSIRSDPENRAVPLVEILDSPDSDDVRILVLPLLRFYDEPEFETIGEAVHFIDEFMSVGHSHLRVFDHES